jgi:DNA-binding transcriptional regulator LsrR (DeoR family)
MAITDNIRMTIKVCQLYYEDDLSQKEISAQLGISRPQISRMLTNAKANNIVSFKINNPYIDETRFEHLLIEKYHLKDALVVNTDGANGTARLEEFGKVAASCLDAYISDDNRVGVMSGKTISSVVLSIKHFERRGLEFIPLVGGIGSAGANFHANVIAQRLAECSGGSCSILNAPVIVQSEDACNILKNEPEIAEVLKKGNTCDVAIVGIGQINERSTTVQAGALSNTDIENLKAAGAVASVCTSYIDSEGRLVETELNKRSIGQTLDNLKNSKTIAFAIGNSKSEAIKAALLGGYIDIFITDLETARSIIDEK